MLDVTTTRWYKCNELCRTLTWHQWQGIRGRGCSWKSSTFQKSAFKLDDACSWAADMHIGALLPTMWRNITLWWEEGSNCFLSLFASPRPLLVLFSSLHFPLNEIILISSQEPSSFHHTPPPAGCVGVQLSSRMKPAQEVAMYFTEKKIIWGPCFTANPYMSSPGSEAAYSHCSGSLSLDAEWKALGIRPILIKLAL